jgi:hypothetical protein
VTKDIKTLAREANEMCGGMLKDTAADGVYTFGIRKVHLLTVLDSKLSVR